jgi:hypothetical protein
MRCELFLDGERDRFIECVCVAYDDAIVVVDCFAVVDVHVNSFPIAVCIRFSTSV